MMETDTKEKRFDGTIFEQISPLTLICGFFIVTFFVCASFFADTVFYVYIFTVPAALLTVLFLKFKSIDARSRLVLVSCVFCCLSVPLLYYFSCEAPAKTAESYIGKTVYVSARIKTCDIDDDKADIIVETTRIDGAECRLTLRLFTYNKGEFYDKIPHVGDSIVLEITPERAEGYGGNDNYYRARGIYLVSDFDTYKIVSSETNTLTARLEAFRELLKYCADSLKNSALIRAITLGDKGYISDSFRDAMQRTGVSHFLAVSGLHLTVVIGGFYLLLELSGVHRRLNASLSMLFCIAYMAICGFSASVVRAGVMLSIYYIGLIIRREPDALTSLFVSGAVILTLNPNSVFDISFQLSFLSTFGIIAAARPYCDWLRNRKMFSSEKPLLRVITAPIYIILSSMAISVAAMTFSFPALMTAYRELSPFAPLYNIPLSIIFTPLLYSAVLYYFFSGLTFAVSVTKLLYAAFDFLSDIIGHIVDFLSDLFTGMIYGFAETSMQPVWIGKPVAVVVSLVIIALVLIFTLKKVSAHFYPAILLIAALLTVHLGALYAYIENKAMKLYVVETHTDSKLFVRYDGLVLAGETKTLGYHTPKYKLEAMVEETGIEKIDLYVLTSLTKYSAEQTELLMRAISISRLAVPEPQTYEERKVILELLALCEASETKLSEYSYGDDLFCGEIRAVPLEKSIKIFAVGESVIYSSERLSFDEAKDQESYDVLIYPKGFDEKEMPPPEFTDEDVNITVYGGKNALICDTENEGLLYFDEDYDILFMSYRNGRYETRFDKTL